MMDRQPDLYYRRITDGSEEIPNNVLDGMLRCRHAHNPDFRDLYPLVSYWFVEVDGNDDGRVLREVGFQTTGAAVPIVLGPYGKNPGLWTTLDLCCGRRDGNEIGHEEFEAAWRELYSRLTQAADT